jgi:hypothetical protein
MNSRMLHWGPIAATVVLCLVATDAGAQCALCRSLLGQPEAQKLANALRAGIVILLAAPVGVFAVIALAAVRSRRRIEMIREQREENVD